MPDDDPQPATKAALKAEAAQLETRLTEALRDMQSEILRGLEAFARGNFARIQIL